MYKQGSGGSIIYVGSEFKGLKSSTKEGSP
jgi:hypothetical protein